MCKLQFVLDGNCNSTLQNLMVLIERLNLAFKRSFPSNSKNGYMVTVIDEYSCFLFAFTCPNMTSSVVIECLNQIFTVLSIPSYIHSDWRFSFLFKELHKYFNNLGTATSWTTPHNPQENGQCELYNGIIWKHVPLVLALRNLQESQWEVVLPVVLHAIRSLLCRTTITTCHEKLFSYHWPLG